MRGIGELAADSGAPSLASAAAAARSAAPTRRRGEGEVRFKLTEEEVGCVGVGQV